MYEINVEAARLAKRVVDECNSAKWVAGSVGPTNKSLSMSPSVENPAERNMSWNQLVEAYITQSSIVGSRRSYAHVWSSGACDAFGNTHREWTHAKWSNDRSFLDKCATQQCNEHRVELWIWRRRNDIVARTPIVNSRMRCECLS